MTRRTIYRTILAMSMLPNFTAYWWLLPRRMKRFRTAMDVILWRFQQEAVQEMLACRDKHLKFMEFIRSGKIEPISQREFRLPFQRSV